jgi:hypothetical protein
LIQIAFAGHNRPEDLGAPALVSAALDAAFGMIRDAGVTEALMLTGLAAGADDLAARAWLASGLGAVHGVFPFLDDDAGVKVGPDGLAATGTWLNGAESEAQGRSPYLKQTRMIVEAADLVVAVWTGGPARGAGGTADAVFCAMEMSIPVLWIQPAKVNPLRLIMPGRLPSVFHFPEFQEALDSGRLDHVEIASPEKLKEILDRARFLPAGPAAEEARTWTSRLDDLLHKTLWRTYRAFRQKVGGRLSSEAQVPVPASLAAQPGFQALTAAQVRSDHMANRLSAVHRSEQVLLVLAMITAALVGSAPAIWPDFKVAAVWIELGLSAAALLVWIKAAGGRQHEHWSQQRIQAEGLRLERAAWAIGFNAAKTTSGPSGQLLAGAAPASRGPGLPTGRYDRERVESWGAWALGELVYGQAAYHRAISVVEGRIAHRIHNVENASVLLLFVVFTIYVTLYALHLDEILPNWASGVVTMTGTVVPAVAAASIALEAKLEFQEQSTRSRRIAASLENLVQSLGPAPYLDSLQDVCRMAVRLQLVEAKRWQDATDRRQLIRA